MRDYFHGWRRKAGCIVLVVVIALSCVWMRTRTYSDRLRLDVGPRVHEIASRLGGVMWSSIDGKTGEVAWETLKAEPYENRLDGYLDGWTVGLERLKPRYWYVMYWWLICPLTLLSAYLILWNPRNRG